jgi:hypothetical protein
MGGQTGRHRDVEWLMGGRRSGRSEGQNSETQSGRETVAEKCSKYPPCLS